MSAERRLPRSAPEVQGISSAAIQRFVDALDRQIHDAHSVMIVRHGHVVAEGWWHPFEPALTHVLFSLSKSFTSTAIGLLVAEGRLSVEDRVVPFFPDDAPAEVNEHLQAMRVHDLLAMASGHAEDTLMSMFQRPDGNWVRGFLAQPVEYAPGTHFVYNSGATYMLSAILQHITGETLLEYLTPRLLEPLGITGATWESCPRGINTGGWGLKIRTEDIATFGQLYLQQGEWHGQQLIAAEWVAQATSRQVANGDDPDSDWAQGYGYQFWRCRHNAYRGDGAFGQFCVVLPEHQTVLAMTSGTMDLQGVLNVAWEHLLPALEANPLPDDPQAYGALQERLKGLALSPQTGQATSPLAAEVSGRRYLIENNEPQDQRYAFLWNEQRVQGFTLDFSGAKTLLTLEYEGGNHEVTVGSGEWVTGISRLARNETQSIAASGAWTDEQTYVVQMYFQESPFCYTFSFHFEGERVEVDRRLNVAFGPTEGPKLIGRRGESASR